MSILLKAIAGVLITIVLCYTIPGERKELSLLLCIAVTSMVITAACSYLKPVITFCLELKDLASLNTELTDILITAVGIGLIAEITSLICKDFGNGALGKAIQFLSTCVTLWFALPIFRELLRLIESVLGAA